MKEGREHKPRDIGRKYGGNDLRGRKNLVEGAINEWKGVPEAWQVSQDTSFVFEPESEAALEERVVQRVDEIARTNGIELILAGRDFPLHTTVQAGDFKGEKDKREEEYRRIASDPEVISRTAALGHLPLTYKYLLVNGDNITLNAVEIPSKVVEFRDFFSQKLQEYEFGPKSMENILHITIARIKKLPREEEGKRRQFINDLIQLRHELSAKPVDVRVDHVFVGQDMMNKRREEI